MEREIKRLKRSWIPLVKVRWNSRRGPEFTWECEDLFKQKYPQLFTNQASSSTTSQMIDKYFVEYIGIKVKHFRDTLIQHMGNVKKSVAKRTCHQRQYDKRLNKRQMQTQESKFDSGKALDADLVVTQSSGTESEVQDESNRPGNDTDTDDEDIRPIYNEEPMAEVQLTAECNIFATGQQHTEQPEIINERRVDQYTKQGQVKSRVLDLSFDKKTTEFSIHSLESENILIKSRLKKEIDVAKLLKENETLKKHYKDLYDSIKITRSNTIEQTTYLLANNANLKAQIQEKVFAIAALKNELRKLKGNSVDTKFAKTPVMGKPILQPLRNQSVVRQPNAFKSERPKISKPRFASQVDVEKDLNSFKNMPGFSSNDMVHNHYLEEAKKKTQERNKSSKSSLMHTASLQTTTKGSKPKPRRNNQTPRSLPVSKSSCVTITAVPKADHSKSSSSFSDSKHFIFTGNRFSPNKTSDVYEKTSPRSDLRWKPTGRIFKTIRPKWIPMGKILASCTSKNASEPAHVSNVDIPNIHESKQTLDLSTDAPVTRMTSTAAKPCQEDLYEFYLIIVVYIWDNNKEDESKEEGSVKSSAIKCKDHEMTVESEEEFEEETEKETKEEEETNPEHFDAFPTMKELGYHEWLLKNHHPPWVKAKIRIENLNNVKFSCMIGHFDKKKAYLDVESPINVMSRLHYNWIMSNKMEPRRKPSNPKKIYNFVGRVRGLKVFIGNFTYECDFMVLEDTTSVIDHDLGSIVFGKPFMETTRLVYDMREGTVMFEKDKEKIMFKMPHKMEMFKHIDFMDIKANRIPPFVIESDDDNSEKTHYSDSLDLGPEYKYDENVYRAIRSLITLKARINNRGVM
ncbi:gag-pol polyprotein [Tanacetum coccineum]